MMVSCYDQATVGIYKAGTKRFHGNFYRNDECNTFSACVTDEYNKQINLSFDEDVWDKLFALFEAKKLEFADAKRAEIASKNDNVVAIAR